MKNFKKIGALLFLSAYLIIGLVTPTLAANNMTNDVEFTPQIGIPGTEFQQGTGVKVGETVGATTSSTLLARYVAAFYTWGLSIVGVLAVLMLMAGGITWLTSAGDSGKIGNAKKMISGSLFGTLLLVGAYFFLNTINPDITKLPALEMANIKNIGVNNGFMDGAEKLRYVCMASGQTCAQTVPASLNINLSACQAKLGDIPNCNKDYDKTGYYQVTWCCGMNSDTQAVADKACVGKANGTACRITDTGEKGTGYCSNNKCKQCINFGSACSNDYECKSGSLLSCGYGDAAGVDYPSNCSSKFCANKPAKENAPCGANDSGTCQSYTGIFSCPDGKQAVDGGTSCDTGLKCCSK